MHKNLRQREGGGVAGNEADRASWHSIKHVYACFYVCMYINK